MEKFLHRREKRLDAVLAYFLVETKPALTLSKSKFYDLFTPKTKYLLSHPVCQLVTELRKQFNHSTQMHINLQPIIVPELQILKQGIRGACHDWAKIIKQQPHQIIIQPITLPPSTSPINVILPTASNEQEQPPAVVRAPTKVDRVQRFIGHEFVKTHPRQPPTGPVKPQDGLDHGTANGSAIRKRTIVQNTRYSANNRETLIDMIGDSNDPGVGETRRPSGFLGKECSYFFRSIIKL